MQPCDGVPIFPYQDLLVGDPGTRVALLQRIHQVVMVVDLSAGRALDLLDLMRSPLLKLVSTEVGRIVDTFEVDVIHVRRPATPFGDRDGVFVAVARDGLPALCAIHKKTSSVLLEARLD